MRRGLGVAHSQQNQQKQQQMATLGAQITAERVSQVTEQLETLEAQLRAMAQKHSKEIKHDPVVRARFRQLADSLGVDLISSKKNVFSGLLGLGDFYYRLAGKVVEACMAEKKFCGSYVPVSRVLAIVQKSYDSAVTSSATERTSISEGDIYTALSKLQVLGDGYNVVELGGVKYIQTTPDGGKTADEIPLLNYVLAKQKEQIRAATQKMSAAGNSDAAKSPVTSLQRKPGGIGAAYVLGDHPLANLDSMSRDSSMNVKIPIEAQYVSLTEGQLCDGLHWPAHRVHDALVLLVQSGAVWVEYPEISAKETKEKNALDSKEVWKVKSSKKSATSSGSSAVPDKTIYWFMSLTSHADNTSL